MKFGGIPFVSRFLNDGLQRRGFLKSVYRAVILASAVPFTRSKIAVAADAPPQGLTFSRIGMCVSDLDRSVNFYRQALGFDEIGQAQSLGKALATAFQVNTDLSVRFVRRDGITLELLHFDSPRKPELHPMNQPGLTNLTITVDDIDKTAATIRQHGGKILAKTRTRFGAPPQGADIIFCTDPDGVRLGLEAVLRA